VLLRLRSNVQDASFERIDIELALPRNAEPEVA